MRRPPPPRLPGSPKTPGSGRKKGSLNKKSIELRALMAALAGDVVYQHRLRQDFVRRRVHPTTEALVWAYAVGKPVDKIEMSANVSIDKRLAAECEVFGKLDVEQLRVLAAESQALVDKAMAMVRASAMPPVVDVDDRNGPEPTRTDTDVTGFGDGVHTVDPVRSQTGTTPVLVAVSSSAIARAENVRAGPLPGARDGADSQ